MKVWLFFEAPWGPVLEDWNESLPDDEVLEEYPDKEIWMVEWDNVPLWPEMDREEIEKDVTGPSSSNATFLHVRKENQVGQGRGC